MLSSRPRYEDKLFQNSLAACIEGIAKFPVDKRPAATPSVMRSFALRPTHKEGNMDNNKRPTSTPFLPHTTPQSSPPSSPTPSAVSAPRLPSQPLHAPAENEATMSPPAFAGSGYSGQDVRSHTHFAIQPSATPTKVSLKKAAVKIVRPVSAATPTAPPATRPAASPLATPNSRPKAASITAPAQSDTPQNSFSDTAAKQVVHMLKARALFRSPRPNVVAPKQIDDEEADLDAMFARLTSPAPSNLASSQWPAKDNVVGTVGSEFVFVPPVATPPTDVYTQAVDLASLREALDEGSKTGDQPNNASQATVTDTKTPEFKTTKLEAEPVHLQEELADVKQQSSTLEEDLKRKYLQKALEYIRSLSELRDGDVRLVWTVSMKMNVIVAPNVDPSPSDINDLKYVITEAVTKFLNGLAKAKSRESIDPKWLTKVLDEDEGNFFCLCAKLVDRKLISVDNLDEVVGLCNTVMNVLPKQKVTKEANAPAKVELSPTVIENLRKGSNSGGEMQKATSATWNDPMEKMSAWPSAEKRDNIAGCRTVILKGVRHPATVNQIQALVWGGRIESIHLPEPGKSFAMVKFQTADGCQKYFDATENGIEMPGSTDKRELIFVERQPGPNSVNDLLQNCIDGNFTRCVCAMDADDDWSFHALKRLAQGNGMTRRELDTIKQGKTARGRHYIEFRFANIYHALDFKRALSGEEDWEACHIGFAEDPCAVARGVHVTDEDEA